MRCAVSRTRNRSALTGIAAPPAVADTRESSLVAL
jgi:hypothetical protein